MQAGADLDAALIDACRSGDRTAFAQIIERYHRAVYAVAFSNARDRALADDITQDTFVTAWRRLDELRDKSRLPAWLCGIARNLARDARKRRWRETDADAAEPIDASTPYDAMTELEEERLIAAALGQVPDVYREPLVLFYYEDRSVDDVARSLGITAATTNKRLSRGRRFLAERVATIVERGVARRGPNPALATSVLAVIGVTAPASHVDASPAKGSTMHKIAIATAITAALGGGAVIIAATATSGADAHARPNPARSAQTAHATHGTLESKHASKTGDACDAFAALAKLPQRTHTSAPQPPALPATTFTSAGASDCVAVGRHLAELEADVTHGPDVRPDDATCDKCAGFYTALCEKEGWSAQRRACALAAADLINAHLCAGPTTPGQAPPPAIPAALECGVLGPQLATMAQGAGLYTDVPDLGTQVATACDLGNWSLQLRQCFSQATSVPAAQACLSPAE